MQAKNLDEKKTKIKNILNQALKKKLIKRADKIFYFNALLEATKYGKNEEDELLGLLTPLPSWVREKFFKLFKKNPKKASKFFYDLSKKSGYIKNKNKNEKWTYKSEYGKIKLEINLAKPEKDPAQIAAAARQDKDDENEGGGAYPRCVLCRENEGFAGDEKGPNRKNLRLIPLKLKAGKKRQKWYLQYSPYVYYPQHCILLSREHLPMKMDGESFDVMFDFVKKFPHYFIGQNAELPIVGGSILSHNHFQAGKNSKKFFALFRAKNLREYDDVDGAKISSLHWPISSIKLRGEDEKIIKKLAKQILTKWQNYDDEKANILSHTGQSRHNTITPVLRKSRGGFELYLMLRNNRTSQARPEGIFHAREAFHHIKKENIGLIEAMGQAILPARLKDELESLAKYLKGGELSEKIQKHLSWANSLKMEGINESEIENFLHQEVGKIFVKILQDCAVFKNEGGMDRFVRESFLLAKSWPQNLL